MISKTRLRSKKMYIAIIVSIIVFIFLPTSAGGNIYGVSHTILVWTIAAIMAVYIGVINRVNYSNMIFTLVSLMLYMVIVTLLAQIKYSNYHVSLARIAPLIVLIYFSFIKIRYFPDSKKMRILLQVICIILIIWNLGIMMNISPIIDLTYNNFNQYFDLAVHYSVIEGHKPVLTFGVHTYASYFYFILFILCYYTYERENKKIFLVYALFLTLFCLFLLSTTAIIFFVCMLGFLGYKFAKKLNGRKLFFLIVVLCILGAVIYMNYPMIYAKLYKNFTSGENSFISRYSKNSVFTTNFKIVLSSLGIGFNILEGMDIGYSDSGYIVYLTMGSIPLLLTIYYRLFIFLKNNISADFRKILIFVIFAFEVALPASFNYRFTFMLYFVICYLNSLSTGGQINEKNIKIASKTPNRNG